MNISSVSTFDGKRQVEERIWTHPQLDARARRFISTETTANRGSPAEESRMSSNSFPELQDERKEGLQRRTGARTWSLT